MRKQPSNPDQLCFSIGRSLPVLIEEIQKTSGNQHLRRDAEQMLEVLGTFKLAQQAGISKSDKTNQAIYEILSK